MNNLQDKIKLTTAPSTEPISLSEAKAHMRVDFNNDDTYIENLIVAAREFCETMQNRAYITQTWELALDAFINNIELPNPPLQSVISMKYYDTSENEITLNSDDYFVDTYSEKGTISLKHGKYWPSTQLRPLNGVIIRYIAGYGNAATVPIKIKQAILMLVAHWYENREPVCGMKTSDEIKYTIEDILRQDKMYAV